MTQPDNYISAEVLQEIVESMDIPPVEQVEVVTEGWDYRIVTSDAASWELNEDQLNILGRAGWELVFVRQIENSFNNQIWYYLKRTRKVDDAISTVK